MNRRSVYFLVGLVAMVSGLVLTVAWEAGYWLRFVGIVSVIGGGLMIGAARRL